MQIVRIGDGATSTPSAEVVGAKAANLARMAAFGLPVPPAFVLPVELCAAIVSDEPDAKKSLADGLADGIAFLEKASGRLFGDRRRPLLVSVRSGAARSMPGMLETVLNVGCTADAVQGLIRLTGHPRFAWDCRRRFLESYAEVVLGLNATDLAQRRDVLIADEHVDNDRLLDGEALERLTQRYQQLIEDEDGALPDDPLQQLTEAAEAVYRSWMSERACTYRRLQGLDGLKGTAVTVQTMVYGNRGSSSGAGVAFSRNPSSGAPEPVIDVLFGAQGEDVVSGRRSPEDEAALRRKIPEAARQLNDTLARLEREFADVQDVEFTIEDGKLFVLQTRSAKRTPRAALQFAVDLVEEKLITPAEALRRLDGVDTRSLAGQRFVDPGEPDATATGASTGVAAGRAVFDTESAIRLSQTDEPVILMRPDTSTADVGGFAVAQGIVTGIGGRTAHAALVARQMGKPCVVGCRQLSVDVGGRSARLGEAVIHEGDWLSIDGEAGRIYRGRLEIVSTQPEAQLKIVAAWRAAAQAA
jgi:pyruvate,orthophosphate dikinase